MHIATAAAPRRPPTAASTGGVTFEVITNAAEPGQKPWMVKRQELVSRLVQADGATLVVVAAPAGYGKSTLLWEWEQLDERPFVWLDAVGEPDLVAMDAANYGRGCVVVIDDAHLVPADILPRLLDRLRRWLPRRSAIAVASRTVPALPIGRLRAHRAVVEVHSRDLAMTPLEAAVLIRGAGLDLDFEGVQALTRRTEGWPVGLYLAALALLDPTGVADSPTSVRGDHHLYSEYFRDELLASTPPDLLEFMKRSSVLDELSGDLCDEVLAQHGSGLTLARLARLNLFLCPIDDAHERYRWHVLLRESLEAELRRADPGLARELHLRASGCLYRCGELNRAIDHAAAANDERLVGELLWPNLPDFVASGEGARVKRWLSGFDQRRLEACPPLALSAAHVSLAMGDAVHARRWRVAAASALGRDTGSANQALLAVGAALIDAMGVGVGLTAMREAAERAYHLQPVESPWRPMACLASGIALHLGGSRDAAARLLEEGMDLAAASAPSICALCAAEGAVIALEGQDWESAGELSDLAVGVLQRRGLEGQPALALVFAAAAATRARQGRSDEAKRALGCGVDLLADLGDFIPWYGAETRILLAHASLGLADIVRARTLLAEASRLARRTPEIVSFQSWFDAAWEHIDTLAESSMAGPSSLTIAELRILRFLPSHRSFREIAAQLGVSANTVKTQAHAVYRKLGAVSRSDAVARASAAGLLGQ